MTPYKKKRLDESYCEALKTLSGDEYQETIISAHIEADALLVDLLIKLGFRQTAEAYGKLDKEYSYPALNDYND